MLILQPREISRRQLWLGRLRLLAWIVAAVLAVVAWSQRAVLLRPYRHWKQERALREAREFMARHDAANAQMALQVAFAAVPNSIEAYRLAAEMLEQAGSAQAVRIRRHLVTLSGVTAEDRAALVICALRFRDFNTARDALGAMTPAQASEPPALQAALAFALNTDNAPVADALFDRMRHLYPENEDFRVAQAVLHLRHPRPAVAEAARRELEGFAAKPPYALGVHRQLLNDALVRRDLASARRWSDLVVADPRCEFSDRLVQANFLVVVDKQPFDQVFAALAGQAAGGPDDAAQFVRWLLVQRRTGHAVRWIEALPEGLRRQPAVAAAEAEAVAQKGDWDRLEPILEKGAWGPVPRDAVRLAMAARLVGNRGDAALRLQVWKEAVQASQQSLAGLNVLQRLAGIWRWDPELEHTLWTITRTFPDQAWVDQTLFNYYREKGDTADMRSVMAHLREGDGSVPRYQHDWALLTLLLEPAEAWTPAKEELKTLYQSDRLNPSYAAGYAFALARSGRGREALGVVRKLSSADRAYPPRLPYLAYIYGVNRMKDQAERLEEQARNVSLLPEEKRLFVEARIAADRKAPPVRKPAPGAAAVPKS